MAISFYYRATKIMCLLMKMLTQLVFRVYERTTKNLNQYTHNCQKHFFVVCVCTTDEVFIGKSIYRTLLIPESCQKYVICCLTDKYIVNQKKSTFKSIFFIMLSQL